MGELSESDLEAREKDENLKLSLQCPSSRHSLWRQSKDNQWQYLCESYWPPKRKGKFGKNATWLVLFISSAEMKCKDRDGECMRVRKQWSTVADKLPDLTQAWVGVVDCDDDKAAEKGKKGLCEKQGVGFPPKIVRYRKGKKKVYDGEWEIPRLSEFVTE